MILLIERRIVILTPPKTASDSLHRALCSGYGGVMVVGDSMYPGNVDKHTTKIPNEASGFKVLATVRQPLDRLVSLYCHYARTESEFYGRWSMAFWEFVNRVVRDRRVTGFPVDAMYCLTQAQHLNGITTDGLLRCESLEADLVTHGIDVRLTRENTSHRRPWRDYFDAGLLATVQPWAAPDCERFGYGEMAK